MDIGRDIPALEAEVASLRAENARLREDAKRSEQLVRELGDAVAARDTFIAVAGHELRNPMGAIMVAATSLAHRASMGGDALPPWLVARLATLERQARSFIVRATTLLDVSRISTGNLRLEPELVDLSRLVQDTVEALAHEAELAKSTLEVSVEQGVYGWWDRVALDQVVTNLVQNAVKYGPGKPVKVRLSAANERVTFSVQDHGVGIGPDDRDRIFSRFERAVTQRTHGGFGLGLWIARELIEASGGTIRVSSEPGVGSIFTVELPHALEREAP